VVLAAVVAAGATGAWAWSEQQDAAAEQAVAQAQASAEASARARAAASERAATREATERLTQAVRAAEEAALDEAADALRRAVKAGRATLADSKDEVADDDVRRALAAALRSAADALEALDEPASSPDQLRALSSQVTDARAAVRRAHETWRSAQQRAAQQRATRTPAPRATGTPPSCRTTYDGPPFYTSPPTAGGDGSNGRLPASMLAEVPWQPRDSQGNRFYLRPEAAAALGRLDAAFRARFGHHLALDLTYRDYETQVAMREALGSVAAVPGTSKHGTGTALDVPELPCDYGYGTAEYRWLIANGPSYGWVQPSWARENGSAPEYWHYEYVG